MTSLVETMLRKLVATVLVIAATLVAVPTVTASLRSASALAAPFSSGEVSTRGWSSPQPVEARRLKVGVPVQQTLTIENVGSLPANYQLNAEIDGDRDFASHLWVVAVRVSDGAIVFSGPATTMGKIPLGRFNEHTRETYRLRVTLTAARGHENALQGRSATIDFDWIAIQA